jgi:hypothetical protein
MSIATLQRDPYIRADAAAYYHYRSFTQPPLQGTSTHLAKIPLINILAKKQGSR